ncbi:MAG: hypothetical protein CVU09_15555 [Bacteroidetes bacterium HGW-Bacteroidetes-4]|jgi:hypothetical protein|nr:MAG: hypothetical protein CVU09_15555 [Bacteroidetes bacterium HGW-Bacteroidetes-4]
MSELSNTKALRQKKLHQVAHELIKYGNSRNFLKENPEFIDTVIPSDFITLFDALVSEGHSMEALKTCSNKILNLFHRPISNYKRIEPQQNSFLALFEANNTAMEQQLNKITPVFKAFNKDTANKTLKNELSQQFKKLQQFESYYIIKENILFPVIEGLWTDYRCLQLMWSFHDDIRRNIKKIIETLNNEIIDLKEFNRWVGDVFFNMMTIKFREEHILFPYLLETMDETELNEKLAESSHMELPYIKAQKEILSQTKANLSTDASDLDTGLLTVEQIKLIFNHLPVDITYVDENDTVRYFSTPKKRIFPRTKTIIGRKVHNCHPPESVHVVEKIVDSFKSGEKDEASFWIDMKGQKFLIQYFAVRDSNQQYKGVIEVSQEISEIQTLKGEKRLLDWE